MTQVLEKRGGLPAKAQVRFALLAGETDTARLAEVGNVAESTIRKWIPEIEREESAILRDNRASVLGVTSEGIKKHQSAVEILGGELEGLGEQLAESREDSSKYKQVLASFLSVQKRLSELSGVEALMAGHKARAVSEAKREGLEKEPEPGPSKTSYPPSGPVVPI